MVSRFDCHLVGGLKTIRYARLQVSYSVVRVRVERFHLSQGDLAARYVEYEN